MPLGVRLRIRRRHGARPVPRRGRLPRDLLLPQVSEGLRRGRALRLCILRAGASQRAARMMQAASRERRVLFVRGKASELWRTGCSLAPRLTCCVSVPQQLPSPCASVTVAVPLTSRKVPPPFNGPKGYTAALGRSRPTPQPTTRNRNSQLHTHTHTLPRKQQAHRRAAMHHICIWPLWPLESWIPLDEEDEPSNISRGICWFAK